MKDVRITIKIKRKKGKIMNAYSSLAKIYDKANTDFDYSQYFEFIKHYLTGKVVELACGSGAFTSFLVKVADSVIAVDNCKEMLDIAINNNFKNRGYLQFVHSDLQNFTPLSKVNGVVAVSDGFNYIDSDSLGKVFEKISSYLKTGGYFIFDISSKYKLTELIGNNVFFEDMDDYTYLWTNELYADKIKMNITMFEPCGELYKRFDESHTQYIHEQRFVTELLEKSGFDVQVFDGEKFCDITDKSIRLLFICKKVK